METSGDDAVFTWLFISEKSVVLPGNTFREFDDVFVAKRCCYDVSFLFEFA